MSVELLRAITPYILGLFTIVWGVIVFVINKTFASKKEASALRREQHRLTAQFNELKDKVDELPKHKDFSSLQLSIETLRGEIKEIRPQLKSLHKMSDLLIENELKERT